MKNHTRPTAEHHRLAAVRLDGPTLSRIDALRARYSREGQRTTRSDVLRILLLAGLNRAERRPLRKRRGPQG